MFRRGRLRRRRFPVPRRLCDLLFRMGYTADNSGLAVAELAFPEDELRDDDLAAAAAAGDETAFALLFERHRRLVARLAYRFFSRREEVEEVIQESFTAAYCALGAYQGGRERSFTAWLSRITIYACYNELRRRRRGASALSEEEAETLAAALRDEGAEGAVERAAISRDLAAKLLARLRPDDRLVLTLLNVEGLSVAETAELTGWSPAKVKMRAHRARAALRKVLHRFL
jgi:RNA polymerase sigma-70 factor (ECF subfamily)